jgi:bacterioferritin-associated ferredoxin
MILVCKPVSFFIMYVCVCNAVTERQVRESVACGADSLDQLSFETGLGVCCGCCKEFASSLLQECRCRNEAAPAA